LIHYLRRSRSPGRDIWAECPAPARDALLRNEFCIASFAQLRELCIFVLFFCFEDSESADKLTKSIEFRVDDEGGSQVTLPWRLLTVYIVPGFWAKGCEARDLEKPS
jgi:hypothetical protein